LHGQHLAFGDAPLVIHAGKLANGQSSALIKHRAFGAHPAERSAASAQIGEIGGGLRSGFDGMRRGKQLAQFAKRRSGAADGFGRAAKRPVLVLKPERADTTGVIDRHHPHCKLTFATGDGEIVTELGQRTAHSRRQNIMNG
jgi:hypothetical protein